MYPTDPPFSGGADRVDCWAPAIWLQSLHAAALRVGEEEWVVAEIESAAREADLDREGAVLALARVADLLRRIGRARLALEMELVAARRWRCFQRPSADLPDRAIVRHLELNLDCWRRPAGDALVELAWMPSVARWVARAFSGFGAYLWLLRVHPGLCPEIWEAWANPGTRLAVPVYGLDEVVSASRLRPAQQRRLRDDLQLWIESAVDAAARDQFGAYGALFKAQFAADALRRAAGREIPAKAARCRR